MRRRHQTSLSNPKGNSVSICVSSCKLVSFKCCSATVWGETGSLVFLLCRANLVMSSGCEMQLHREKGSGKLRWHGGLDVQRSCCQIPQRSAANVVFTQDFLHPPQTLEPFLKVESHSFIKFLGVFFHLVGWLGGFLFLFFFLIFKL